uniref:Uncharacterized protein n=1 Tax=Megaselia scalaris TaxID=36166 RepID=T1H277_MEGSC
MGVVECSVEAAFFSFGAYIPMTRLSGVEFSFSVMYSSKRWPVRAADTSVTCHISSAFCKDGVQISSYTPIDCL